MKRAALISFFLAALFLAGCKRSGDSAAQGHDHGPGGHSHGAEEEEKTAQITIWSERFEIFAEHKAPIAGAPTKFITHVTDIKTGEPRRSGMIKFLFEQGDARFEHPQAAPDRAGIYIPAITFPKDGEWKTKVIVPGENEATVDLGAIKVFANADAAKRAEFPEAPEGISFLKEQQWRILAKHEPAQKRALLQRLPLHATVVPAPGSKALAHSQIVGTLLDSENSARLGSAVKAGDIIAWVQPAFGEFSSKLIEAEADAIRTKAAFEQAQTYFDRTRRLFEQQAKSERELKEAEVAFRAAQASYEAAAAVQKLYKGTGASFENGAVKIGIAAPINGVVDRVLASAGARVTPEEPIFSIVNANAAFIQAQAPEARLAEFDLTLGAHFAPASKAISPMPVKFLARGQEVDASSRTIPLTFEFEKPDARVPLGSVGTLSIGAKKVENAIAIPAISVVEEDGVPVVFVQVSGETYEKRDVILGARDGAWIEAKSGVRAGERVATDGAYAILLSTKSGVIPAHGHAH